MNSMSRMPFLNSNYNLLIEVEFPVHNPNMDSEFTTLYIFDVSDEKAVELGNAFDSYILTERVMHDLDISNDYNQPPGARYHRFRCEMPEANIVYLYDTVALNV